MDTQTGTILAAHDSRGRLVRLWRVTPHGLELPLVVRSAVALDGTIIDTTARQIEELRAAGVEERLVATWEGITSDWLRATAAYDGPPNGVPEIAGVAGRHVLELPREIVSRRSGGML